MGASCRLESWVVEKVNAYFRPHASLNCQETNAKTRLFNLLASSSTVFTIMSHAALLPAGPAVKQAFTTNIWSLVLQLLFSIPFDIVLVR